MGLKTNGEESNYTRDELVYKDSSFLRPGTQDRPLVLLETFSVTRILAN